MNGNVILGIIWYKTLPDMLTVADCTFEPFRAAPQHRGNPSGDLVPERIC